LKVRKFLFKSIQGLLFIDIINLDNKGRLLNLFLKGLSFLRRQIFFKENDNGQIAGEFVCQSVKIVRKGNKNP